MTTHTLAAAQPTATGKRLWPLHLHDGRIYAGYGDYSANTGPIHVCSAHPGTLAWTDHHTLDTEAIYLLRTVDDDLYVPCTDPRGPYGTDFATDATGSWVDHQAVQATHAFGMNERVAGELWLVGSHGYDAVAWKRVAGMWSEAQRIAPPADGSYNRFYFAAALDGTIYVQAVNSDSGPAATSRRWNGSTWANGPDLLSINAYGWNPTPWGTGFLLHQWGHGALGRLGYWNGTTMTWSRSCTDYTVTDDGIFVLEAAGKVVHSEDFTTWEQVGDGPSKAIGLAVIGSTAYLGCTDATIESLVLSLPGSPPPDPDDPPVPEPIPPDWPASTASHASAPRGGRRLLV